MSKDMHPYLVKFNGYMAKLDSELNSAPLLVLAEQKTKIPKTYMVLGSVSVFFLLIFLNVWGNLLTNLLGFLYPAYQSFKALETSNKEDDAQWLMYWTVFAFFNVAEFFSDMLLHWIPFYYTLKAGAVLYLMLPQTRGATVLYTKILRPYLVQNTGAIDGAFNKAAGEVSDFVGKKDD